MLYSLIKIVFVFLYVSIANAQDQLGILVYTEKNPKVYSLNELRDKGKYRAYQIGALAHHFEFKIAKGSLISNSPLFNSDGENTSWEHILTKSYKVPPGTLWLCLPTRWRLTEICENEAILITASGIKGSIEMIKQTEGIEINVKLDEKNYTIYYYLGYGIE